MHKKLIILFMLISKSIVSMDFDKKLDELKKSALNLGKASLKRASFEDNIFTEYKEFEKCKNENPQDPKHIKKCEENFKKEIDEQLYQDGINILQLIAAYFVVTSIEKTIEKGANITLSKNQSTSLAQTFSTIPRTIIDLCVTPLFINVISIVLFKSKNEFN